MGRLDLISKIIEKEIEDNAIAGANVLVLKNGELLYKSSSGYANKERNLPMKEDTIIHLFSMTKPVTAAATMILFERGMLDLYDAVSDYLPAFKNQMVQTEDGLVKANRDVTIRDLLNMTSGICYPHIETSAGKAMERVFNQPKESGYRCSTYDLCNLIGEVPLMFQPGEHWMYGASADVLGGVIEVITGKTFGEFLKEEIFEPLGMEDTFFRVPTEKRNRLARMYTYGEEGKGIQPLMYENLAIDNLGEHGEFESGGAGLLSTINDYAKFATMLLNEGTFEGKQILSRKTVRFMRTNQLTLEQKKTCEWDSVRGYGYGNLMRILVDPALAGTNASIGEFGWDGWTGNYVTIDPEEKLIFMYFIQLAGAGVTKVTRKLRAIVNSAI